MGARIPNGALEVVCRVKAEPGAVAGDELRRGAGTREDKVGEVHVRVLAAMACREQSDAGMARVVDPRDVDRLAHEMVSAGSVSSAAAEISNAVSCSSSVVAPAGARAMGSDSEFDCVTASSDLSRVAAGFVDAVTIAEVIDG